MIYHDLRLPTIKLFEICKGMPSPHLVDALPSLPYALLPVFCEPRHDQEGCSIEKHVVAYGLGEVGSWVDREEGDEVRGVVSWRSTRNG